MMTSVVAKRRKSNLAYVSLILRLLVGSTLLFSGVTKLPVHNNFVEVVISYHILPEVLGTAYAMVLPWAEFVFGAYLVLGIMVRPSAFASVLLGTSFTIANVIAILRGEEHCTSCFGNVFVLLTHYSLAIDVFIIIAGVLLLFMGRNTPSFGFDDWFARRQRSQGSASDSSRVD